MIDEICYFREFLITLKCKTLTFDYQKRKKKESNILSREEETPLQISIHFRRHLLQIPFPLLGSLGERNPISSSRRWKKSKKKLNESWRKLRSSMTPPLPSSLPLLIKSLPSVKKPPPSTHPSAASAPLSPPTNVSIPSSSRRHSSKSPST